MGIPTVTALLSAGLFFLFVAGVVFVIWKFGTLKPSEAIKLIGTLLILLVFGLGCVVPTFSYGVVYSFQWFISDGPLGQYTKEQFAAVQAAGAVPAAINAPIATSASEGPTATAMPTLPPAPTLVVFNDVLSRFSCTSVQKVDTVATVTLYQWSPTGVTTSQASDGLAVAGWTNTGQLLACPVERGMYLSANEVKWAEAGIQLPVELLPTATPVPTSTPDPVVAATNCQNDYLAWKATKPTGLTNGTDAVPAGYQATLQGPGWVNILPGEQGWTVKFTVIDEMSLIIPESLALTIPGAQTNGQVEFTGTGNQCQ